MITHTYKCVVSGEKYFSKNKPIGEPIAIPIKSLKTKFQSILFQTYGAIKILINTSRIKIIGTISMAGSINEKPEIQVAENPNPLKPLIIEAINTVNKINENSKKLSSKYENKFIKTCIYQPYTLPKLKRLLKLYIS